MTGDSRKASEARRGRVLITGGAGYVGSVLTGHLLGSGWGVTVLDNLSFGGSGILGYIGSPGVQFEKGDIVNRSDLREACEGANAVVHLAAIVGEAASKIDPERTRAVNTEGCALAYEAAVEAGAERFLFFSTCSSYGVQKSDALADEDTPMRPVSLYAETKLDAEAWLRGNEKGAVSWCALRPSTVHGPSPRMRFDLIVNHFVADAYRTGALKVLGSGLWRPLIWVGDIARAVELLLDCPRGKMASRAFNVGNTTDNFRKVEIAERLKNRWLPDLVVDRDEADPDLRSYRVDFSRIESELGFRLSKSLEEAMGDVLQLLRDGIVKNPASPKYHNHLLQFERDADE